MEVLTLPVLIDYLLTPELRSKDIQLDDLLVLTFSFIFTFLLVCCV